MDAAQGITSGEHINALPRGTAGITAFKHYVAESRHVSQVWAVISEIAVFEAVKHSRALGNTSPVTLEALWDRMAEDMSRKPYKALGIDLVDGARRHYEQTVEGFMHFEHRVQSQRANGRRHGAEARALLRDKGARETIHTQLGALDEALGRNAQAVTELGQEIETFLSDLRNQKGDLARQAIEGADLRQAREEASAQPWLSPSPYS